MTQTSDKTGGNVQKTRACGLISDLGRLLRDGQSRHPQALLERARQPGRFMGTLARALQDFFLIHRLALPLDQAERLAAGRRQRRIDSVPDQLRPPVAAFVDSMLHARRRALRAGTRPRADHTIETHLSIVRDLAKHVLDRGKADWATLDVNDLEAFLATNPASRKRRLVALRQFFGWARQNRFVVIDPTRSVTAVEPRGFRSPTLTLPEQQALFRRWTGQSGVHPHEAFLGLLALLHGASSAEARHLTLDDIDHTAVAVHLGKRPNPTPLDPAAWAALLRCLAHRTTLRTTNPHVIVTKGTKLTSAPASPVYTTHVLDSAGIGPRTLRNTRLLHLTSTMDPKLVAAAFGMNAEAVLPYLADHVDADRIGAPWTHAPDRLSGSGSGSGSGP